MNREEYKSTLFVAYNNMRQRCLNPNNKAFPRYGGKGIGIDSAWSDFASFKAWAESSGFQEHLTLDRKDNDLGYSPQNCRWATYGTQNRNRGKHKGGKSTFIGVSWYARHKKWGASVRYNRATKFLGLFVDEEAAAKARDEYLIENKLTEYTLNFK